jgi:hypothetical protein
MLIHRQLPRLYRPSVYQGPKNPKNYFEGWYFKFTDSHGDQVWSVIPGVSFSKDTHSFIQVIEAKSDRTWYRRYPIEAFSYNQKTFNVRLGGNEFSEQKVSLDIDTEDLIVKGEIAFGDTHPFPVRLFAPGIMGWYAYVPFMECYHGVVSMQHSLSGSLKINGSSISFNGGKGYIEKDWGKSMPTDWIWMQSNHFNSNKDASFMLSLARIPWLKGHFPGFLSFLHLDGRIYRFATYNRSNVVSLKVLPEFVSVVLKNKNHQLTVEAIRMEGSVLKAPRHGNMDREIKESILSRVNLELKDRHGNIKFKDMGRFAGLEIVGDMEQYYQNID